MEPQRRELLAQCQQSLAQAMTEVEAVLGLLEAAGALSPGERRQLDEEAGGTKAELLLKLLLAKERDHFQDLRAALEKTQPHLLPILYLNGVVGPPQPAEGAGSTYSVLSIMPSDSESSSSLSSVGTTGKAPSPPPLLTDRQVNEKVENLSIQLRLMTRERNELRKRLAFATHGTACDKRPYHRLNPDYERLKTQCVRAMSDLQSLQSQHTNALKRCEEVAKETDFYHTLHSRLLSDQTQLKDDVDMLRRENGQLLRERNLLQQSWEDMKRLHEEDQKEIGDLRAQQQQVLKHNGSSEILNKLYDTALDKLEVVKKDYDALRKRYSEKVAIHNSDLSRLEQLEEENQRLLKQTEMLTQQRDTAIQLQHQCALSLRRFEAIHHELNKATAQNKDLQWEMELLQSELTELRTTQAKTAKESEKYKEERDAVYSEYKLIMSERDQVISELDKLQTEVELAESKLKSSTSEKKAASEEMEALRQAPIRVSRQKRRTPAPTPTLAASRTEILSSFSTLSGFSDKTTPHPARVGQIKDTVTMDAGRATKEAEILRKQCKALCQELKEALQEADVAKCRRDWAFQERDKIVAERDSIRTLCDNLRRERDRAVSELAEALRSLDDTRKQKNDVSRELKELKEQMESQLEKEARFRQLMAHSSHDSAIDTDSMEWETEVVEFERETEDIDLKALGFDMAEGVNEPCLPGDCGIFVTKVDKGSIADGRLRVNDWLLRINDVDLVNKDKKQALQALLNGEGAINMVVRRRKSLGGKVVTPLHINLSGQKDSGISLENGVYAAAVVPGSPAAKEGSLAVGDRIVAINGIALDNKSLNECESLLRSCQDSLTLSLLKARVRIASSYYPEADGDSSYLPAKKSCDEDLTSQKMDELGQKRRRPKSAPSFRPKLAPVAIPAQFLEEQKCTPASGTLSPELQEWSPYSPGHSSRHSNPPLYPNRASVGTVPRSVTPSTTVSSILRNPIYTVRSHRIGPCSSPPVPREIGPQGLQPSVQHQGRLSLDLSHRACSDYSEMRASHGSNSLPSSARLGSSSNLQFKAERIKIPSTPRYPRSVVGSDRGSLSHSECSTPPQSPLSVDTLSSCSQSQTSASTLPRIAVNPVALGERRKDRPYMEEPRHVKLQKGSEPLGISIVSGEKGGVYVSKVTGGSIAHQAGLVYGDQLLEFNGINLRSATEQQARLIIGQQCDTITILAQYNPHMHQLSSHSRSSSHLDPAGAHCTVQGSGAATPEHPSGIDPLVEQDEGPSTPPAKQSAPSSRMVGDANKKTPEPRVVFIKKSQLELGVHLCGGNLHGVFVAEVEDDSPAKGPEGLVPGDLILEYGGLDVRSKTVEEVYVEMLKPKDGVRLKVQYRPEEFTKVKGLPGDSFYIRALYDRLAEVEPELSFKKDDILYVDDTLPQGTFGSWMAWQLDENAQKIQRGQIPSKYVMDQEFSRRLSMSEVKDDSNAAKTLSAAARRSFFRRKHKHKRSGSKDGKDLLALDTFSNDSIPLFEDLVSLAYQRVQKVDCTSLRPVLVLGPLLDVVKEMLVNEAPGKFCRCPLEVMKASQQAIERGVKDCLFVDYKRRSGHFDVTTVASIKEITEKNRHCLLDIGPHAIERLHHMHIYPIVIFIHYKSAKHIKEQRDPIYLKDKVTQRHSKEQFEAAQKVEQEYSRYFTGVVQGGALSSICTQILAMVNQEQNKVLWIPACPL
ncbi:disks large homolog 5 isoform X5 [Rhinolophus ferrumequinum]|uniref:disks large homolog 5 isoform X5 n=1 Tax=Rhinolophus ferrumequinum TaxID=59479 RepID=UPI00140FE828|nr:disks large homolog 5 isoform X5 [Rhinolophus ferrumequinum]